MDERALVTDVNLDAGRPYPLEHRVFAQVAPRHVVAHLCQRDRDRAHPGATDADDVETTGTRQIERWQRRRARRGRGVRLAVGAGVRDGGVDDRHDASEARATRSIRAANSPDR
jgi:hypothetical protein